MPNNRRRLVGRVVSDKMQKTVVVAIDIRKRHPIYKKVVRVTKKVYAHDESNAILTGSIVQLVESKPLSKTKRWVVEKVIEDVGNKVIQPIAGEVSLDTNEDVTENDAAPEADVVTENEEE